MENIKYYKDRIAKGYKLSEREFRELEAYQYFYKKQNVKI